MLGDVGRLGAALHAHQAQPVRQLKELARQAGVRLIRTAALDLVRRGFTTVEEVNRVTIMA